MAMVFKISLKIHPVELFIPVHVSFCFILSSGYLCLFLRLKTYIFLFLLWSQHVLGHFSEQVEKQEGWYNFKGLDSNSER